MDIELLESAVDNLNQILGAPLPRYAELGTPNLNYKTHYLAKVGNKYQLQRIVNAEGCVQLELSPFPVPAQILYDLIHAYIKGIEQGRKAMKGIDATKELVDEYGVVLVLMEVLFLVEEADNFNKVVVGFEGDGAMSDILDKLYNEIC